MDMVAAPQNTIDDSRAPEKHPIARGVAIGHFQPDQMASGEMAGKLSCANQSYQAAQHFVGFAFGAQVIGNHIGFAAGENGKWWNDRKRFVVNDPG